MKILLTGSSGFIGRRLLNQFADMYGKENIVLLSSKKKYDFQTIVYTGCNFIIPPEIVKDVDLIFHAGAFIPKVGIDRNDINKCNENIFFTERLLDHSWVNLKRIIFMSTIDVYHDGSEMLTEESCVAPNSLYGMSKFYCERMINVFCNEKNILNLVLRIGHVYGPGEELYKKIIPITIQKILNNESIELWGDGSDIRSFIFIDDLVRACSAAVVKKNLSGLINVAGSTAMPIKEVIDKISSVAGKESALIKMVRSAPRRDLTFDTRKMKETILCHETDMLDGLKMEVEYFRGLL